MKIIKFTDFINEELNDTPESYISIALSQLKKKIDKMFDFQELEQEKKPNNTVDLAKKSSKEKSKMTLKDLGVRLESSEISKYSKLYDSLTVKFSDDFGLYNLLFTIDIKEAIPTDSNKDFSFKDIKKSYLKFKKYNLDTFEVIGQLTKNIELDRVDEDFLIELKIEIDDTFDDKDELEIETEE